MKEMSNNNTAATMTMEPSAFYKTNVEKGRKTEMRKQDDYLDKLVSERKAQGVSYELPEDDQDGMKLYKFQDLGVSAEGHDEAEARKAAEAGLKALEETKSRKTNQEEKTMKGMNNNVAMMTAEEIEEARARRQARIDAQAQGPMFHFPDLGLYVTGYGATTEEAARKIAEETVEENLMEDIVIGPTRKQANVSKNA